MNLVLGKILYVARWGTSIVFIGLVTGVMAVIFPPLALAGGVALAGVFLFWALPELRVVPEKTLRTLFFMMVAVQLCVPSYYAIETGYVPWISVRRLFSLAVIILFSLTVAGSKSARGKVAETVRANRWLAFASFGFLVMMFASLVTSANVPFSLKEFSDAALNWYVPLFACIFIVRSEEDVILLLKIIAIAAMIDSLGGVIEFAFQHRFYFDLIPKGILDSMLANNPTLAAMYYTTPFRNGLYRASSIYSVPLSFGEFAAMVAPIAAYFVFHGRDRRERVLGIATGICSSLAIFCSGARGAYTAVLVAMPIMAFIWTVRYGRRNPHSLISAIMGAVFVVGTVCVFGLVTFWPRFHDMVIGSEYEGAESTEARFEQWELAKPHILANPVTGHGMGNSSVVVGYHIESGIPSVDSYIITLLVEVGVPGLLFFFGMIAIGIWTGIRVYLADSDVRAAFGGPLACSLIAFTTYRLALSQTENHNLAYIIIGLVFAVGKLAHDRRAVGLRFALERACAR